MHFHLLTTLVLVALVSYVQCGCEKSGDEKNSEEGGVTNFFKNLGCDIKKGAEKVSDSAKPWVDEIGKSARKFGGSVADTFTDLKEKISGTSDNSTVKVDTHSTKPTETTSGSSSSTPPQAQTPTSFDDRFLLDVDIRCPDGKQSDGRGHCRDVA